MPYFASKTQTEWYRSSVPEHTARLLRHLLDRAIAVVEMLDEAEVVTKNRLVHGHRNFVCSELMSIYQRICPGVWDRLLLRPE